MASAGQPVSNLVQVSINLSSSPAQGENVDTMLIVGSSNVIDVSQRMRNYSSLTGVANDFGTSAAEYLASQVWFAQNPQPLSVNIGRWAQSATSGVLQGAPQPSLVYTQFTGITTGGFTAVINGMVWSFTGINLSAVTNLNGVASAVQTALQTLVAGATCVWNSVYSQFEITVAGSTGTGSTISLAQLPTATGYYTFTGVPAANDTVTIEGVPITFVASGPTGNQVLIGGTAAATALNLYTFLIGSTNATLLTFNYFNVSTVVGIEYKTAGSTGDAQTIAKSSTNITVSGATLAGGNAVDISVLMGINATSSGAYVSNGIAAETLLSAVETLDNMFSNQWYGLAIASASAQNSDYIAVAGYVEGDNVKHYFAVTDQEGACLTTNDSTSLMYQLNQLSYNHTAVQYSSQSPYAAISMLARILTTNWEGSTTTITLQFKTEPGIVGENLPTSELNAILSKKGNVYIQYNNSTTIIQGATSSSGQYIDTIIGFDWFAIQLQTDLYNALYVTPTKIPQTDAGMTILHNVIDADCAAALNNGLLGPGTWTLPGFGAIQTGQYLSKGYYIYQPPIASQTAAQRGQRISVPFQIAAKTGGAVHDAQVAIQVNQ